jgi:nucleotide-binding universal stress UspA family protein
VTVVVGFVPKPEGRAALEHALAHARDHRDDLVVVNSAHGAAVADSALVPLDELNQLLDELNPNGDVKVDVRQRTRAQDPVQEVLEIVEGTGARLLVIGLRRRSSVGKLFLGSNAQGLLLQAPCPVLAVKAGTSPG